ncbi:MAG: hypothetical protein ABI042_11375 [Verrucomicrobiota bacterium]
MNILSAPSYRRAAKKRSAQELADIAAAVADLPGIIGQPHQHSGRGIRRLKPSVFEFRVGLKLRVLFTLESGDVILQTVGNHDHIKQFLRENF